MSKSIQEHVGDSAEPESAASVGSGETDGKTLKELLILAYDCDKYDTAHRLGWALSAIHLLRQALAAPAVDYRKALTDEQIIAIRDEHLPSQGESFDCLAFARALLAAQAPKDADE